MQRRSSRPPLSLSSVPGIDPSQLLFQFQQQQKKSTTDLPIELHILIDSVATSTTTAWRMAFSVVERCESHLFFHGEVLLPIGARAVLYVLGLGYCFLGLSEITVKFFRAMEGVVGQEREVEVVDPVTGGIVGVQREKLWNFSIADVTLLALGTSFPQISLATIDAIRNLGQLYSGGLGPGTLVGSAAFDLFPIHAVCVVVPRAGSLKRISDLGVWLVELFWSFWAYIWLYIILEVPLGNSLEMHHWVGIFVPCAGMNSPYMRKTDDEERRQEKRKHHFCRERRNWKEMWTPKVVTLLEALLTVLQFGILLLHVYAQDKRWPYLSIPLDRNERPKDWVPEEDSSLVNNNLLSSECFNILEDCENPDRSVVELVSIYSGVNYESVPDNDVEESSDRNADNMIPESSSALIVCREQLLNVLKESPESKKVDVGMVKALWRLVLMPWRIIFAFVPPCHLAHGWLTFICSLISITGIAYMITKLTDAISCVTGINPYVIALTALAGGTSWPDLVASKIAAERQTTADSSIANITCSNSVNIYVGIGMPWLINTIYNHIAYNEPLHVQNAAGLGFTLLVFFATSVGCVAVLVLRRLTLGAELGGPRPWAWATCAYLMLLWIVFVVLSSLKVSGMI